MRKGRCNEGVNKEGSRSLMVMGGDDEERSTSVGIIKTNSEQEIKHGGVKQDAVTPSHVRTPVCRSLTPGHLCFSL